MPESSTDRSPLSDRDGGGDAARVQILATEHWSLLTTRSMIWNESFSRAGMFLTVLSAAVVALALVAQATDFDREFRLFALLVLPVVLFLGWATYTRVATASAEDLWLIIGMNRLRHAYLELAPELEPYFVTAHHDDEAGVLKTMTFADPPRRVEPTRVLASTTLLIGIISAVVAGVCVGLVVAASGGDTVGIAAAGILAGLAYAAVTFTVHFRDAHRFRHAYEPRFPGPGSPRP
jgi:hypothetical protein